MIAHPSWFKEELREQRVEDLEQAVRDLADALQWIATEHPRVIREMPKELYFPAVVSVRAVEQNTGKERDK